MNTRFCLQKPRLRLTDRVDYLVKEQKKKKNPMFNLQHWKWKHTHTYTQHQDVIHIESVEMHSLMNNVSSTSHLKFTVS